MFPVPTPRLRDRVGHVTSASCLCEAMTRIQACFMLLRRVSFAERHLVGRQRAVQLTAISQKATGTCLD